MSAGAREWAAAPAADEARERAAGLEELLRARAYLFELFLSLIHIWYVGVFARSLAGSSPEPRS